VKGGATSASDPVRLAMWAYIGLVLFVLYLPLLFSVSRTGPVPAAISADAYLQMWSSPLLLGAIRTTLVTGVIVAVVTPLLGLLAAMAIRERRLMFSLILLPLFVPGVSMGLAILLFRQLGIPPSLLTIALVQIKWASPFAPLIILTVMASSDPVYLEAAYMSGAGRLRAFLDVELPAIRAGLLGAASFSLTLSFNETIRTSLVQGPFNTVQTYIWSTYKQVGLSPVLYALMSLLILELVAIFLLAEQGQSAPT
jgi:spermidine/putrescine transport system permease protein